MRNVILLAVGLLVSTLTLSSVLACCPDPATIKHADLPPWPEWRLQLWTEEDCKGQSLIIPGLYDDSKSQECFTLQDSEFHNKVRSFDFRSGVSGHAAEALGGEVHVEMYLRGDKHCGGGKFGHGKGPVWIHPSLGAPYYNFTTYLLIKNRHWF
ncbi:hypothetical protein BJ138DRAFT_1116855 [Hygrophoropsis aurantiaca]|uniref:Uncharacterized protein n=1 Tax=Hygrophoropsis aurantiaca TaxID=72124 RepID=A0ACB8A3K2_9AGAM|nr:hypothetical protein BJ138DRAFT_1116855 [Hygrophoropsis aurantiaca]